MHLLRQEHGINVGGMCNNTVQLIDILPMVATFQWNIYITLVSRWKG
jgi:hypothetical protein